MNFQQKMMCGTIETIIEKAVRDIQEDSARSIRKLVDLGEYFAHSPMQKYFFDLAQGILSSSDNPYIDLVADLANYVDLKHIKRVGRNFGYISLTYGVSELRRQESQCGYAIPWLLNFDLSAGYQGLDMTMMQRIIEEACALGIYTYIFSTNSQGAYLPEIFSLAEKYPEASFFFGTVPEFIDNRMISALKERPNMVPFLGIKKERLPECSVAFTQLAESGLLYGFYLHYEESDLSWMFSSQVVDAMVKNHCYFGGYICRDATDTELQKKVYRAACQARGRQGKPLLVFELYQDAAFISNAANGCRSWLNIFPDGTISRQGACERIPLSGCSFLEVACALMPKLNAVESSAKSSETASI